MLLDGEPVERQGGFGGGGETTRESLIEYTDRVLVAEDGPTKLRRSYGELASSTLVSAAGEDLERSLESPFEELVLELEHQLLEGRLQGALEIFAGRADQGAAGQLAVAPAQLGRPVLGHEHAVGVLDQRLTGGLATAAEAALALHRLAVEQHLALGSPRLGDLAPDGSLVHLDCSGWFYYPLCPCGNRGFRSNHHDPVLHCKRHPFHCELDQDWT